VGTLPRDVRYDVGVTILDKPVSMATYGALPKAGLVNTLKEGQRLTVVGYGVRGFDLVSKPPLQPQPLPQTTATEPRSSSLTQSTPPSTTS
jgi:hypothetical protein